MAGKQKWSDGELFAALERVALTVGLEPGDVYSSATYRAYVDRAVEPSMDVIRQRFGSWPAAVEMFGMRPERAPRSATEEPRLPRKPRLSSAEPYSREQLLAAVAAFLCSEYDTYSDWCRAYDAPGYEVVRKRLGGWKAARRLAREYLAAQPPVLQPVVLPVRAQLLPRHEPTGLAAALTAELRRLDGQEAEVQRAAAQLQDQLLALAARRGAIKLLLEEA